MPPSKPSSRLSKALLPYSAAVVLARGTNPQVHLGQDACHLWKGKPDHKGYGTITFTRSPTLQVCRKQWAHRVAYALHVGDIPKGMTVEHICRNPSCVNPKHLTLLTVAQNTIQGNKDRARGKAVFHEPGTMCPHCHSTAGDECRCLNCGKVLPKQDLLNGMAE